MTPKEKAEKIWMELFQKQIDVTGNGDGNLCVEMALIAVDEILKSKKQDIIHFYRCGNEFCECGGYWQEVKQEIINL